LRELDAEHFDVIGVKEQIAQLVLAMAGYTENTGKGPRLAAHLRFEFREHHALPAAHWIRRSNVPFSQKQALHNAPCTFNVTND
jgi:hypothetical protein